MNQMKGLTFSLLKTVTIWIHFCSKTTTIRQVFLKSKIMDNIHKYYYLIAFTAFMRYNHSHQYQGLVTEAIHWEM